MIQRSFDFGTTQVAANDPVYSNALFIRAKRDRTFYGSLASKRQWRLVMERERWCCKSCGARWTRRNPLKVDHIIPVAAGGDEFCLANQQALCDHCHRLKTSTDFLRYGWRGSRFA